VAADTSLITGLLPAAGAPATGAVRQFVNANQLLTKLVIKNGQNIILDLQSEEDVKNYFLQ